MSGLQPCGDRGPVSLEITREKTNFCLGICDFKVHYWFYVFSFSRPIIYKFIFEV